MQMHYFRHYWFPVTYVLTKLRKAAKRKSKQHVEPMGRGSWSPVTLETLVPPWQSAGNDYEHNNRSTAGLFAAETILSTKVS